MTVEAIKAGKSVVPMKGTTRGFQKDPTTMQQIKAYQLHDQGNTPINVVSIPSTGVTLEHAVTLTRCPPGQFATPVGFQLTRAEAVQLRDVLLELDLGKG